jgi:hypothetical protein
MEGDLHLTAHHLKLHESLREDDQRPEILYTSKNGLNRVLSVEISPTLYWFATTDGEDK